MEMPLFFRVYPFTCQIELAVWMIQFEQQETRVLTPGKSELPHPKPHEVTPTMMSPWQARGPPLSPRQVPCQRTNRYSPVNQGLYKHKDNIHIVPDFRSKYLCLLTVHQAPSTLVTFINADKSFSSSQSLRNPWVSQPRFSYVQLERLAFI